MLLISTTDPLPAHRPWSGGSTSLKVLVVCVALSTAFRPFTAVAPPAEVLMLSQPGRSGCAAHRRERVRGAVGVELAPLGRGDMELPEIWRLHRVRGVGFPGVLRACPPGGPTRPPR